MAIAFAKIDSGTLAPLPLDERGIRYYPTLNVATVRTNEWCTTISAYTYKDPAGEKSKYMHRPVGGNICNLWLKDHGYFQASSQTIYKRWEPMSFPEMEDVLPLTPRIEFINDLGYFTNLYEFDALLTYKEYKGSFFVSSIGELKNSKQQEGGISYRLSHAIGDYFLTKKIELIYHDVKESVRIIEPIIEYSNMSFTLVDSKTVHIEMKGKKIELTIQAGNVKLELGENKSKYRFPYPALRAYPIVLRVENNNNEPRQMIEFRYRIIR